MNVYNNVFSLNYLDHKSKHFFFFFPNKLSWWYYRGEILNMKFRDNLLPMVCVFSIVSSSHSCNFRSTPLLFPDSWSWNSICCFTFLPLADLFYWREFSFIYIFYVYYFVSSSLESRDDWFVTFSWEKEVLLLDIFTGVYDGIKWPLWQFGLDRLNLNNVL